MPKLFHSSWPLVLTDSSWMITTLQCHRKFLYCWLGKIVSHSILTLRTITKSSQTLSMKLKWNVWEEFDTRPWAILPVTIIFWWLVIATQITALFLDVDASLWSYQHRRTHNRDAAWFSKSFSRKNVDVRVTTNVYKRTRHCSSGVITKCCWSCPRQLHVSTGSVVHL